MHGEDISMSAAEVTNGIEKPSEDLDQGQPPAKCLGVAIIIATRVLLVEADTSEHIWPVC